MTGYWAVPSACRERFCVFTSIFPCSGGLSKDEVENMVRDAEAHAADDKLKKDRIEASNQVRMLLCKNGCWLANHQLTEYHNPAELQSYLESCGILANQLHKQWDHLEFNRWLWDHGLNTWWWLISCWWYSCELEHYLSSLLSKWLARLRRC